MALLVNMAGFCVYQSFEYGRILNIPVLWIFEGCEIPQFQMCKSSEYTWFTLPSKCSWISPGSSLICLIMCNYARMLNTSLILSRMVSLRSQFVIFENSAKINLHLFYEAHYHRFLTNSKSAWDPEDASVLDLALFLNKPAVFICTAGIMIF